MLEYFAVKLEADISRLPLLLWYAVLIPDDLDVIQSGVFLGQLECLCIGLDREQFVSGPSWAGNPATAAPAWESEAVSPDSRSQADTVPAEVVRIILIFEFGAYRTFVRLRVVLLPHVIVVPVVCTDFPRPGVALGDHLLASHDSVCKELVDLLLHHVIIVACFGQFFLAFLTAAPLA